MIAAPPAFSLIVGWTAIVTRVALLSVWSAETAIVTDIAVGVGTTWAVGVNTAAPDNTLTVTANAGDPTRAVPPSTVHPHSVFTLTGTLDTPEPWAAVFRGTAGSTLCHAETGSIDALLIGATPVVTAPAVRFIGVEVLAPTGVVGVGHIGTPPTPSAHHADSPTVALSHIIDDTADVSTGACSDIFCTVDATATTVLHITVGICTATVGAASRILASWTGRAAGFVGAATCAEAAGPV